MRIKKHIYKKGFTLLETLVAVFILTLALTGPIYIASLAIRGSVESRDNISAYHLAQEAIEVIRNKRDYLSLQSDIRPENWLIGNFRGGITGGVSCMNPAGVPNSVACYMTRNSTGVYTFTQCSGACAPLLFNPNGSILYGETGLIGAVESKFTREIYLQTASQDNGSGINPLREVDVVVTIKWMDKGRQKQFKVTERLHNQQYAQYYVK